MVPNSIDLSILFYLGTDLIPAAGSVKYPAALL